jgi:hypothetical protein
LSVAQQWFLGEFVADNNTNYKLEILKKIKRYVISVIVCTVCYYSILYHEQQCKWDHDGLKNVAVWETSKNHRPEGA